ncbi:MAG: TIGR00341 family protein [Phycisphaeraceae bacterium]
MARASSRGSKTSSRSKHNHVYFLFHFPVSFARAAARRYKAGMALRLIEIVLPRERGLEVRNMLQREPDDNLWQETLDSGQILLRFVVDARETGPIIDRFHNRFGDDERFQLLVVPVAAALPRREAKAEDDEAGEIDKSTPKPRGRGLSREELHHEVSDMTQFSGVFIAAVLLSSVVATVGMMRDNVAAIIGAMVIAPLLGPNVALAFATTIGDTRLLRRALATNLAGIAAALALAAACGVALTVDPTSPELASRTSVALGDVALALASGTAGALALTTGVPAALVGVMVAVALLPPTIALGLMIGSGYWPEAVGAGLLLATNVICVNLAGVGTFLVQGIRPRTWWEAERARRGARLALMVWCAVLLALVGLILLINRQQ